MSHKATFSPGLDAPLWRPGGDGAAVAALLDLVEEAAPDVAAHMNRTARLARLFAVELGLAESLVGVVVSTARLHDVGMLAIPPWVREKPAPLTEAEEQLVRAHPVMGQKILERKPSLHPLGQLVRATHERWDGHGYPDGLGGSAIPLPARIVAVCGAFDSMTSPRVYAPSVSVEAALEELQDRAGTQFDPGAVDVFCRALERSR